MTTRFAPAVKPLACGLVLLVVGTAFAQPKKIYSKQQQAEIRQWTRAAASPKPAIALDGLRSLEALGPDAHKKVISIVRTHLYRGARQIQSKSKSLPKREAMLADQGRWFELIRAEVLDGKAVVELKRLNAALTRAFLDRTDLLAALAFRESLLEILTRLSTQPDARFTPEYEKTITDVAIAGLGTDLPEAVRVHRLLVDAASDDPRRSYEAIKSLDKLGDEVRYPLVTLVRELIARDRKVLNSKIAQLPPAEKVAKLEAERADIRAKAVANIKKLQYEKDDGGKTMKPAREYHKKLLRLTEELNKSYRIRLQMVSAVARRDALAALWTRLGPLSKSNLIRPEAEEFLKKAALKALGMTVEQAQALSTSNTPPSEPSLKQLWDQARNQRIKDHNRQFVGLLHPQEYDNIVLVNTYRAALGLTPYEIDLRIVQSARRHSKEMIRLDYFSHTSPTAANKSHGMRMNNAGYTRPSGENIAKGYRSGEAAFWGWFSSPGHHRNMAGRHTQIGVGKWDNIYTQNFGRDKRRLGTTWADLSALQAITGKVIPPQQ
jgi:uncharacterized protein YkwD